MERWACWTAPPVLHGAICYMVFNLALQQEHLKF